MPIELKARVGKIGVRANPARFLSTPFVEPCKQAGRSAQHEAFQAHRQILLVAERIVDVSQRTAVRKSLFAQRKSERVTQQAVWNGRKLAVGKRARKAL